MAVGEARRIFAVLIIWVKVSPRGVMQTHVVVRDVNGWQHLHEEGGGGGRLSRADGCFVCREEFPMCCSR